VSTYVELFLRGLQPPSTEKKRGLSRVR